MNCHFRTTLAIFLAFILITTTVSATGTMFRSDPQHSGIFSTGNSEPNNILRWSYDEQNFRITEPVVVNSVVYFGSEDHNLYALYAANGTEKWRFPTGGLVRSSPAVYDGTIFFGSGDGKIYALHAIDGSVKWVRLTNPDYDGIGYSSPAVIGGTVYIASYDRNLYAIDAASGTIQWTFPFVSPMGSEAVSSPAVADGVVYFGDLNRVFYAVWASNGTEKWRYTSPGTFLATIPPSAPVVSNDTIYVGGPGYRNLTALWAENGTPRMQITRGYANWELVSPALCDNVLYTGGSDQNLYAIDSTSGEELWSFALGSLLRASPSVSGDVVYAPSMGRILYAIYRENGTEKWRFSPPNNKGLWGAPVISDGIVLIDGDSADHLYAIGNQEPALQYFSGRVFAGEVGNLTARGLRDVPVRLYGSDFTEDTGTFITATVTDSYGYFLLPVSGESYQYFNIIHEDTITGSNPVGAQSIGGFIRNETWIQYTAPISSCTLTDNNFWDFVPTVEGDFAATPLSGPAPLAVEFTDNSTGYPDTWNWIHEYNTTAGNGPITGLSPNTTHTYTDPGVYSVQMRVFNAASSDWVTKEDYINVGAPGDAPVIINHTTTKLGFIPRSAIEAAKSNLHIAYGHTSHGSQLITGMNGLVTFPAVPYGGLLYQWNNGGSGGALDIHDNFVAGDLGNPDRTTWAQRTRTYLDNSANADVNVVIWSWCGQVDGTEAQINTYLNLMNQLEADYPDVSFVYMTGHLNGGGASGNVNQRNEQIRAYCRANNKILYDFADIESYDPDGMTHYMELYANDNCDYTLNGVGHNWATEWQNTHTQNVDWYACSPAHTQALNGNLKAYAAWWLWARLAGWDGTAPVPVIEIITPASTAAGGPEFTISVNGTGFIAASIVRWNGVDRGTTFISPTQLTAVIPASDITAAGNAEIRVFNPAPGGGTSAYLVFTINDHSSQNIGVFRRSSPAFYLDWNGNGRWDGGVTDRAFNFGLTDDMPVSGDWNSLGRTSIGVFRPSTRTFYLDLNGNGRWDGGVTDRAYNFGLNEDLPVSGDWNSLGKTCIGVFRPSTHTFYLDWNGNGRWDGGVTDRAINFGLNGDTPVSGDWNALGKTCIGVFRPSTRTFYLDWNGNGRWDGGSTDRTFNFGLTGDTPISGDWDALGRTSIGVFRPSTRTFHLDWNGNGRWDGPATDRQYTFGLAGDVPVTGAW